jgi:TolA-binding protein
MRNSRTLAGLVAAAALVALVGCSSSSTSSSSEAPAASAAAAGSSTASARPEDERTDAATVATGITALKDLATQIAGASADQGKTLAEGIEPLWQPIEGTVQENSQETYDAFEGAFTQLESGDPTQAAEGARALATAADAYLAEFPG